MAINKYRPLKTALVLLCAMLLGCSTASNEPHSFEKLQADADDLNAKAPYMSDKDTMVLKATAKESVFEIHNMLIHFDLTNLDKDALAIYKEHIKGILTYLSCTIKELKDYPEHHTTLSWQYYDKSKTHFLSHQVNLETCNKMPKK